jgi:hypothetical protein
LIGYVAHEADVLGIENPEVAPEEVAPGERDRGMTECELHEPFEEGEPVTQCWISAFDAALPLLERAARARGTWWQMELF